MTRRGIRGVLVISDRRPWGPEFARIAAGVVEAGPAAFQLREKDLGGRDLIDLARPLARLCEERGVAFLVNDRLDVALALPGAGVHVGVRGLPVPAARRLLGRDRPLGYSAHEVEEAARALEEGADFVTLSPVFDSTSKPGRTGRGIPFLAAAVERLPGPVLALGGITVDRIPGVRETGAAGVAVLGSVFHTPQPDLAAADLVSAWARGGPEA